MSSRRWLVLAVTSMAIFAGLLLAGIYVVAMVIGMIFGENV